MLPSHHTVLQIQLILQGGKKKKSINRSLWRLPTSLVPLNRARCRWAGVRMQLFFFFCRIQTNSAAVCLNLTWPQTSCSFHPPPAPLLPIPPPPAAITTYLALRVTGVLEPDPAVTGPQTGCQFTERQTAVYNHNHTHCLEFPIQPDVLVGHRVGGPVAKKDGCAWMWDTEPSVSPRSRLAFCQPSSKSVVRLAGFPSPLCLLWGLWSVHFENVFQDVSRSEWHHSCGFSFLFPPIYWVI